MRFLSWASIEFSIIKAGDAAVIHTHIKAVDYSDALESALVRGAGRGILGSTDPIYVPGQLTIEWLAKWYRVFTKDATNSGEIPLGELDFRMVLKHKSRTDTEALVDELDYQILEAKDTRANGSADELTTACTCLLTQVKRNGVIL
jgi:hypothetical protein